MFFGEMLSPADVKKRAHCTINNVNRGMRSVCFACYVCVFMSNAKFAFVHSSLISL